MLRQPGPSAFAMPPQARVGPSELEKSMSALSINNSLPPIPSMHRSDTQQSLDIGFDPMASLASASAASASGNKPVRSHVSAVSSIWSTARKHFNGRHDADGKSAISRMSSISTFSALPADDNSEYAAEALAALYLPPSFEVPTSSDDQGTAIDIRLWNTLNGTGRFRQEAVPINELHAGVAPGPNGAGITTISFYQGGTMRGDEAVRQGVVKPRPTLSLRRQEEIEIMGMEAAKKMQSSLTLQGSSASMPGVPLNSVFIPRAILKINEIEIKPASSNVKFLSAFCRVIVSCPGIQEQHYTTPAKGFSAVPNSKSGGMTATIGAGFILDCPMGPANVKMEIWANKAVRTAAAGSPLGARLGNLFKSKSAQQPKPSAFTANTPLGNPTEPVLIGTIPLTIRNDMTVMASSSALVEILDPRSVKQARVKFAAMHYMDEAWMESDEDDESELELALEEDPGVREEREPFADWLTIMILNGKRTNWKRYWGALGDGCFKIFPSKVTDQSNHDAVGIVPLSLLTCISPPDPELGVPGPGLQLSFDMGPADEEMLMDDSQKSWLATALNDNSIICYADNRDAAALWSFKLQEWSDAACKGFAMPSQFDVVDEALERSGTVLEMIVEEDE